MRARPMTALATMAAAIAVAVTTGPVATASPGASLSPGTPSRAAAAATPVHFRRACSGTPRPGRDQCLALLRTDAAGHPLTWHAAADASLPIGYGPAQIQSAYKLVKAAASAGTGQTVAVVDAFDDPNAEADLNAYRTEYGLPPCTSADGCFTKVNQDGATSPLPAADPNWAVEESLDIEMVSAVCPNCHIILAEASSATDTDVAATVASAAQLGATEISNSYGEPEYPGETRLEPFYDQPGIQLTASAGDNGYGVSYPAASASVTSVGGTSLWPEPATKRKWTETAWAGTGSGCSTQIARPAWQHGDCTHRADNDVAADANPQTPVALYDSYGGAGGWLQAGGTSVAAPIVAAVYALLGDPKAAGGSYFYQHRSHLFDVTSGANGSCSPAWLCTAGPGYDGPAGLGTPDFTGASGAGAGCVSNWSATGPPQVPSIAAAQQFRAALAYHEAISTLSRHNVWTVGTYHVPPGQGPAATAGSVATIEHWTGSAWAESPSVSPVLSNGDVDADLRAVSFGTARDGWAVGVNGAAPLAEHWDGTRWSMSPVLAPATTYDSAGMTYVAAGQPTAVAAVSRDDAWLAGVLYEVFSPGQYAGSFLEHWDGHTWSMVPVPGPRRVYLSGLDAISATDIWAVGTWLGAGSSGTGPAILHWDGSTWSAVPAAPGKSGTTLTSVSGSGPDDVWAVGATFGAVKEVPFAEHWNGSTWSAVPVAPPPSLFVRDNVFFGVTAISATDAWAVGTYAGERANDLEKRLPLLEHWDGHAWSLVATPEAATPNGLLAVSASSTANVWIAGSQQVELPGGSDDFTNYPYDLRHGCHG